MGAPPGERHGRAVLTNEKVLSMRKRYAEGVAMRKNSRDGTMSVLQIAIEFDIAPSTAYGVISRRTWKHI